MIFLGWIMDLGTRVGRGVPDFTSAELWESWVFLALLLMPLSHFTALYRSLSQWRSEKTLALLHYSGMNWGRRWTPFLLFFSVSLLLWGGMREYLYPHLVSSKGNETSKDLPIVLEGEGNRWILFPSRDLMSGQVLLEEKSGIRHYQGWSWEKRGLVLIPGKNTSQTQYVQQDQLAIRNLCPSFEHLLILRGLGSDLSLLTLWEYRHLSEAVFEMIKRGLQPLLLCLLLAIHWSKALRQHIDSLALRLSRTSLFFGFVMLALENLL